MQYIKAPYRAATSRTAKRTYLGAALFVAGSLALVAFAVLGYTVFYYNYVPKKLIRLPVHLQYDAGLNPYGIISLTPDLMLEQAYDITVDLTLPRSPANLEHGNFMIALYATKSLLNNEAAAFAFATSTAWPYEHVTPENVVFFSRRPVLIPYEHPLVSTTSRILFLAYHILFPHKAETVKLSIPMGELVYFRDVLPLSVLVDVQAGQMLQVYSAEMTLVARLRGVRWFMYNHRVLAFLVGVAVFWGVEVLSMGFIWGMFGFLVWGFGDGEGEEGRRGGRVKREGEGEEGWIRGRQGGKGGYPPVAAVKSEDDDDESGVEVKEEEREVDVKDESPEPGFRSLPTAPAERLGSHSPRHMGDADDEGESDEGWPGSRTGSGSGFRDRGEGSGLLRRRLSRTGSS